MLVVNRIIKRGEVYYANLDDAYGHEQKNDKNTERRLVVVVSNNKQNEQNKVVVVVPLSSKVHNIKFFFQVPTFFQGVRGKAKCEQVRAADLIIQPIGASRLDLVPAVKEFNALKQAGIPAKKLLLVLTRLSSEAEAKAIQKYLDKSDYNYSPYYLYEKASYKQIQNEGKAITEVKYEKLAQQVQQLIANLLDYL